MSLGLCLIKSSSSVFYKKYKIERELGAINEHKIYVFFCIKKIGQTKILFSSIAVTTMNSFVIQKDFSFSFRQFIYLLLLLLFIRIP